MKKIEKNQLIEICGGGELLDYYCNFGSTWYGAIICSISGPAGAGYFLSTSTMCYLFN